MLRLALEFIRLIYIELAFLGKLRGVFFCKMNLTQMSPNEYWLQSKNLKLPRVCSDCNQNEFGPVCVRFILQIFYLLLISLKRLSRWFYPLLINNQNTVFCFTL